MLQGQDIGVDDLFTAKMPDLATSDAASMVMNPYHDIVLTHTSSDILSYREA